LINSPFHLVHYIGSGTGGGFFDFRKIAQTG
jgi:hypothetical protein